MRGFALALLAVLLAGCVEKTIGLTFDRDAAKFIHEKGEHAVRGQAFLRRNDGIVVYAAGSEVFLVPATDYTAARMAALYEGRRYAYFGAKIKDTPQDFFSYTRKVIADGEGRFEFRDVVPGQYFVQTAVIWMAGDYRQGGAIWQAVQVTPETPVAEVIVNGQ